jgi:signal transduction histidine kinase/FixJ family two-component response regulator
MKAPLVNKLKQSHFWGVVLGLKKELFNEKPVIGLSIGVGVFFSLLVLIGIHIYQQQRKNLTEDVKRQLITVADLKTKQIAHWLEERKKEIRYVATGITANLRDVSEEMLVQEISRRVERLESAGHYVDTMVFNRDGKPLFSAHNKGVSLSTNLLQMVKETIKQNKFLVSDLYCDETNPRKLIYLDFLSPLSVQTGKGQTFLGVLALRVDPRDFLFPLVETWPVPRLTAESLIVKRYEDKVLYLNDLRHTKDAALRLTMPISNPVLTSAISLRGVEGIVEGDDYRGEPVIAALRSISGSSWNLVAKIDKAEVFAPLSQYMIVTLGVIIAVLVISLMTIRIWWNRAVLNKLRRHEADLLEARKSAEEASGAKSEFLANISHEIRTPLNAVLGYADVLLRSNLSGRQKEFAQSIARSGNALLELVNNVLDMSKIEAGEIHLEESVFSLKEALQEVAAITQPRIIAKGIEFQIIVSSDLPENILGDSLRVRQILINLLNNATKFTDRGKIVLKAKFSDNRKWLELQVIDTGVGIDESDLPRIFERFNQGSSEISKTTGGTGLGLAICQKLVNLMNGRIHVVSEKGEGSKFIVKIPYHPIEETTSVENPVESSRPNITKRLSVLLVEDSDTNRELIKVYLEDSPYQLDFAENGAEALKLFKLKEYDIVLMDMQMPVMDGFQATREIRKYEIEQKLKSTPIIGLTAYAMAEEKKKVLEAGCDLHLAKPVRQDQLLSAIQKMTADTTNTVEFSSEHQVTV